MLVMITNVLFDSLFCLWYTIYVAFIFDMPSWHQQKGVFMIELLAKEYTEGPVIKVRLKPKKGEIDRSILITICSGIKRHLHFKEREMYKVLFNISFDKFNANGWVGPTCKKSWHEVPRVLGIRVIYSKKVPI